MAEFWEAVHIRGQQTDAVWFTHAPAKLVGTTTQAMHAADVGQIMTDVDARDVQEDVWDDAEKAVDLSFKFIHNIGVRAPAIFDETLEDDDPLNDDLDDIFREDPDTQHGAMKRARKVISFWNRMNAKRAAMTPPLPPVLVGTKAVADLQTALASHPGLMQTAENELAELNDKKDDLQKTARRVNRINKRWHRLWKNDFDEDSPERNALSQVDTEEGTNPPTAMEVNTLTQSGLLVAIVYVAGGGRSATSLVVVWQVVGVDADFGHARPVILAGQTVGPFTAGQTINFKTRASNSAVTTPVECAVKTITVT